MYLITIKGLVQGVGFRPYIYRKAVSLGERGYVRNTGSGVEIVVRDRDFVKKLTDLPPLAEIHDIWVRALEKEEMEALENEHDLTGFTIIPSSRKKGAIFIPPDISVCDDCIRELRDHQDRRHGYYFITCTNCGPRFSMITNFTRAYDRPTTAMGDFPMCGSCRREYTNPLDRRYHAQTIACPNCGPRLSYYMNGEEQGQGKEAIGKAVAAIMRGEVVAVKGNGGYHLCCLVREEIVKGLRKITRRPRKPYAVMVKDVEMARSFVEIGGKEEELLLSLRRPIVALEKKDILKAHAPGSPHHGLTRDFAAVSELSSLGVMLPYTALHYLLIQEIGQPLVMTSANLPGNPMAMDHDEIRKLCGRVLEHERPIVNRVDDSVLRVCGHPAFDVSRFPVFLRRARGWTPSKFRYEPSLFNGHLQKGKGDILALGAMKNNSISYLSRDGIFLSHYIGNTENLLVFEYLKEVAAHFRDISNARVEKLVCDLHPDFNTTQYARELAEEEDLELRQVQHHLAHAAAVALEHGLDEFAAIVCDGVGYGLDGKAWGGELFKGKQRAGSLEEQPMIGGDKAAVETDRMLYGILSRFLDARELAAMSLFKQTSTLWHQQLEENLNIHHTTSTGRVLDAVAALLGLCDHNYYEGRAPMLLESCALGYLDRKGFKPGWANALLSENGLEPEIVSPGRHILMTSPLFSFIHSRIMELTSRHKGISWEERLSRAEKAEKGFRGKMALLAHLYLARGLHQMAQSVAGDASITFSGGVAVNTIFGSYLKGKGVLLHKDVPPGDGGVSFGQLAYELMFGE